MLAFFFLGIPITAIGAIAPIDENPIEEVEVVEDLINSAPSESGGEDFDVLVKVPLLVDTAQEIYDDVTQGNVDGVLEGILNILGELGLINSADLASRSGKSEDNAPYSNPKIPEDYYKLQRSRSSARSTPVQRSAGIIFTPIGQEQQYKQQQTVLEAQTASHQAQAGVTQSYRAADEQSQLNENAALEVETLSSKAVKAEASQEVLKAISAQNQHLATIGSGQSRQLALVTQSLGYLSAQQSAVNTQLAALNDKAQVQAVLEASNVSLLAQVEANINAQTTYQHTLEQQQHVQARQAQSAIFIPGLNLPD